LYYPYADYRWYSQSLDVHSLGHPGVVACILLAYTCLGALIGSMVNLLSLMLSHGRSHDVTKWQSSLKLGSVKFAGWNRRLKSIAVLAMFLVLDRDIVVWHIKISVKFCPVRPIMTSVWPWHWFEIYFSQSDQRVYAGSSQSCYSPNPVGDFKVGVNTCV
jgi:hypothetical protein